MTATWNHDDLDTLAAAGEIEIAVTNGDGATGRSTAIWIVRIGDDLYIRSYRGPNGSWYSAAVQAGRGTVRAGRLERAAMFDADHGADPAVVDDAYRTKYGRSSYVDAMVAPDAAAATLRLVPR